MSNEKASSAPQNSLALRYSYDQLSPQYRTIADEQAAALRAYGRPIAIADRALIDEKLQKQFAEWTQGHLPTKEQIAEFSQEAKALWEQFYNALPGVAQSAISGGQTTIQVGGGVISFLAAGGQTVSIPFRMPGTIAELSTDFWQRAFGHVPSEEEVKQIATAYASTLQARAQDRTSKQFTDGLFSAQGVEYGKAGLASAWDGVRFDWLKPLAEIIGKLPVIGEFLQKAVQFVADLGGDQKQDWKQHLNADAFDSDIRAVEREFAGLGTTMIDGIDMAKMGQFLARGGEAINGSGYSTRAEAPNANRPFLKLPDAPVNPETGQPLVDNNPIANVGNAAGHVGNKAIVMAKEFVDVATGSPWAMGGTVLAGYGVVKATPPVARAGLSVAMTTMDAGVTLAKGSVNAGKGFIAGVLDSSAATLGGKEWRAVTQADIILAKDAALAKELAAAKQQVATLEGASANRVRLFFARSQVVKIEEKMVELAKQYYGYDKPASFFRAATHVEGAADAAARVRTAAAAEAAGALMQAQAKTFAVGEAGVQAVGSTTVTRAELAQKATVVAAELAKDVSWLSTATRWLGSAMGRIAPPATGVMAVYQTAHAAHAAYEGDYRTAWKEGTSATTVFAVMGVGFLMGGPPGALAGLAVGGLASMGTGMGVGAIYDAVAKPSDFSPATGRPPVPTPAPANSSDLIANSGTLSADRGLAVAHAEIHERTSRPALDPAAAQRRLEEVQKQLAGEQRNQLGGALLVSGVKLAGVGHVVAPDAGPAYSRLNLHEAPAATV